MFSWLKKKKDKQQDDPQEVEVLDDSAPAVDAPPEPEEVPVAEEQGTSENLLLDDLLQENSPQEALLQEDSPQEEKQSWFSRMTSGLSKSTNKLTQGLSDLVTKRKLDAQALEDLEDLLITADLGPVTAAKIIEDFSEGRFDKEIEEIEIREALAESMAKILEPVAVDFSVDKSVGKPFVVLMCGVNGAGKTTSIGKIAYQLTTEQGLKVTMAAGDTFRAAAVEQLEVWAQRVGCGFVKKDIGADAAAVAYEAYAEAKEEGADVLLIDTAGRLQNKKNLMEELSKIIRVLQKQDEALPHATLLVLDSTTGQNAFSQLQAFKEMVHVTGLIVTKLDGSAKGGVLVGLADQFGVPVHAIGVGEGIGDMRPFDARDYARSLMGLAS